MPVYHLYAPPIYHVGTDDDGSNDALSFQALSLVVVFVASKILVQVRPYYLSGRPSTIRLFPTLFLKGVGIRD